MGYCNRCGAPCLSCVGEIDEFGLLALDEKVRHIPGIVLELMEIKSQENLDQLIKKLLPYTCTPMAIIKAYRVFRSGKLYRKHKNLNYFVAMVRNMAIYKEPKLENLPPEVNPDFWNGG